jgi:hypothetical protein
VPALEVDERVFDRALNRGTFRLPPPADERPAVDETTILNGGT